MAYGFPMNNYQNQMYYPQIQNQTQNVQNNTSSIIWVQGEAGAKSYLVSPNTTVALWDSESPTIYLKSADASGMPSIKIYDYKQRETTVLNNTESKSSDFATQSDINTLREEINGLKSKIESLNNRNHKRNNKEVMRND